MSQQITQRFCNHENNGFYPLQKHQYIKIKQLRSLLPSNKHFL